MPISRLALRRGAAPRVTSRGALTKQSRSVFCALCALWLRFNGKFEEERHRKGVHLIEPSIGDKSFYICSAPYCATTRNGIVYSRRDKIQAHLNRDHSDWDVDKLVERFVIHVATSCAP